MRAGTARLWRDAALLLLLGILVCAAFLNSPGTGDRSRWLVYMDMARHHGLSASYGVAVLEGAGGRMTDYPPLGILLLVTLGRIADIFWLDDFLVLKLSLALFTLLSAGIMAFWQGRWQPILGIAAFFVIVLDAMLLAYIDVYFAAIFLLSYYLLERGWLAAGAALFGASVFVKWQPIVLGPLVLLYLLPRPFNRAHLLRLVPAAAVAVAIYAIFGNAVVCALIRGLSDPNFSGSALNFNWLITAYVRTDTDALQNGIVRTLTFEDPVLSTGVYPYLSFLSTALRYLTYVVPVCYFYLSRRTFCDLVQASIISFMCYFIFGHGVHENHAFLPSLLGLCWMAGDRSRYLEATLVAVMFNINLLIFYGATGGGLGFSRVVGVDMTILLAAFNMVIFALLWLPAAGAVVSKLRAGLPWGTSRHSARGRTT